MCNTTQQPKKSNEPIGAPPHGGSSIQRQSPVTSYTAQLKESGLFELHEKITLKLKVIETLIDAAKVELDVTNELNAVIRHGIKRMNKEHYHDCTLTGVY